MGATARGYEKRGQSGDDEGRILDIDQGDGVQSGRQSGVRSDVDGRFAIFNGETAWGYIEFGEIKVDFRLGHEPA